MTTTRQTVSRFQSLLSLFRSPDETLGENIAHPDKSVNALLRSSGKTLRRAAVLLPITREDATHESELVLTVRSQNLKSHAGQISLPGGSWEEQDRDSVATALRESEEEIGLQQHRVDVLGELGQMALPSGFEITPVIGVIDKGIEFVPCPIEVADIFTVPLELVLDTRAYRSSLSTFNNTSIKTLELLYEDYRIWGATAAILYHLARKVEALHHSTLHPSQDCPDCPD